MIFQFLQSQLMRNLQQYNSYQSHLLRFPCSFLTEQQRYYSILQNGSLFFAKPDPHSSDLKANEQADSYNFETRIQASIIIQSSSNSLTCPDLRIATQNPLKKRNLPRKKTAQKETRNVSSNLMRIFLKNVIELRGYDQSVSRMIEIRGIEVSLQGFHEWLGSFGINYKNYIRFTELRRLFAGTQRKDMHAIIRALFRSYVKELGISHTLTSKRIERGSTAMHLEGLRQVTIELGLI